MHSKCALAALLSALTLGGGASAAKTTTTFAAHVVPGGHATA